VNPSRFGVPFVAALCLLCACSSSETPSNPVVVGGGGAAAGGAAAAGAGAGAASIAGAGAAGDSGGAGIGGQAAGGAGAGGDAGGGGVAGSPVVENMNPTMLSETGLYADIVADVVNTDVLPFRPQFQLWSDDAAKRRWVKLPAGAKINTSNMDFWTYPQGTKFWKEFSRDGVRVETRLLWKQGQGAADWFMMAFKWNAEGTDAVATPDGEIDASATAHDIPSQEGCSTCHRNMRDRAIGFSAVQLSYAAEAGMVTLDQLVQMDALSAPPAAPIVVPGTEVEKAAIGYLHANCGNCHNSRSNVFITKINNMSLWLQSTPDAQCTICGDLNSVQTTGAYLGTVNIPTKKGNVLGATVRVTPGDLDNSALYQVINVRDAIPGTEPMQMADGGVATFQMPPLGTEVVDPTGTAAIAAWIMSLPP